MHRYSQDQITLQSSMNSIIQYTCLEEAKQVNLDLTTHSRFTLETTTTHRPDSWDYNLILVRSKFHLFLSQKTALSLCHAPTMLLV